MIDITLSASDVLLLCALGIAYLGLAYMIGTVVGDTRATQRWTARTKSVFGDLIAANDRMIDAIDRTEPDGHGGDRIVEVIEEGAA